MNENTTCPKCQQALRVPEKLFGQTVECPECQHRFHVNATDGAVQVGPVPSRATAAGASEPAPNWDEENDAPPKQPRHDDDDIDIGRARWASRRLEPHRGSTIMALGIISIFMFRLILGAIAWKMGNTDLQKMDEGIMDPAGRSQTNAGRTIGMVMVILSLISLAIAALVLCIVFTLVLVAPN